jgi:hypothetical protein
MTNKLKHNKKRNVGIIYELLVRNMTQQLVLENLKNVDKIKKLIENHFHKKTELYKEYKIFSALSSNINEGHDKRNIATSIIGESKKLIKKINYKKLEKEKSSLIREINYTFGKKFYFERVPNYVNLATIQIALNEWSKDNFNIKQTVMLEEKIINAMLEEQSEKYEKLKESIDNSKADKIVMNIMTKKLNEKYAHMSADQKNLIKSYAFFLESDHDKLIKCLKERKVTSLKLLNNFKADSDSDYLRNKVNTVIDNVKSINENNLCDDTIIKFLTVSQLITELNSEE